MMTIAPKDSPVASCSARKVLDTEIGKIYIYDRIVLMEGKTNVNISIRNGMSILVDVARAVGFRPVVYISNRINAYSVDPNDYKYLEMIPNLKGIAIVTYNEYSYNTARMEENFIKKPFRVFSKLEVAKTWANYVIEGKVIV